MRIEPLERRKLLSAPFSISNGILSISGEFDSSNSPLDDNVSLSQSGSTITLVENGNTYPIPTSGLKGIVIDVGAGSDFVSLATHTGISSINLPTTILGGKGNDVLRGGNGNDSIAGGAGNDSIFGNGGDDIVNGGASTLSSNDGSDFLDGGTGSSDDVAYSQRTDNLSVTLDGLANDGASGEHDDVAPDIENIFGGMGNDLLAGSAVRNVLAGGAGNDTLQGNGGSDFFIGGLDTDIVIGTSGDDVLESDLFIGIDSVLLGTGNDVLTNCFFSRSDSPFLPVIDGGGGNDTLSGDGTVLGGNGDDIIEGDGTGSLLSGGAGNDLLVNANDGPDVVQGGKGFDLAQADSADTLSGIDLIYDSGTAGSAAAMAVSTQSITPAGGQLTDHVLTIAGQLDGEGAPMNDIISAILDAGGSNIVVTQNGTTKTYPLKSVQSIVVDAGAGNDVIALSRSDDSRAIPVAATIIGGKGNDSIVGGASGDSISGGLGNDTLFGGDGDDLLNGGSDVITSGDGADFISGGPGLADTVIYTQRVDDLTINIADGSKANDGAAGEGDNVQSDVENVFSGNGNDLLIGNDASNLLSGSGGNDTLQGGDGNDKLIGSKVKDVLMGEGGENTFFMSDNARDDFDSTLDDLGQPVGNFISGDAIGSVKKQKNADYSLTSNALLRLPPPPGS